jgi:hypothetical protein
MRLHVLTKSLLAFSDLYGIISPKTEQFEAVVPEKLVKYIAQIISNRTENSSDLESLK